MKIKVVSCTKKNKADFQNTLLGDSLIVQKTIKNVDSEHIFYENSRGLCECYNEAIEAASEDEFLIFVHDDLALDDIYLRRKLLESRKSFDILGLAGTRSWEVQSTAVWNKSDKRDWSGAVGHYIDGETWISSFGKIPGKCVMIDGIFIAVQKETLTKTGLRFDPRFTFHHYDLDFCLSAVTHHKLVIGTTPIWTRHASMGDWTIDDNWKENNHRFLGKWAP